MLPPEVLSYGRLVAARTGLDEADGVSHAGQAWAEHPDCWRVVAFRRCVDESRVRHGTRNRVPVPVTVLADVDRGGRSALERIPCDEHGFDCVDDRDVLRRALATMDPRERHVLIDTLMLGRPLVECAEHLGITPSGACLLRQRALVHARQRLEEG